MNDQQHQAITELPEFKLLLEKRKALVWPLLLVTIVSYFAFILFIAFAPAQLGQPIGSSVISIGIAAGIGLILLTFIITAIYVRSANRTFQPLLDVIARKAEETPHA